jgi:hypothetical protein
MRDECIALWMDVIPQERRPGHSPDTQEATAAWPPATKHKSCGRTLNEGENGFECI